MNSANQLNQDNSSDNNEIAFPADITELDIFALMAIGGGGEVVNMN
jgi:hypothetical protein